MKKLVIAAAALMLLGGSKVIDNSIVDKLFNEY
jgi:hypothetical protein